MIKQYNPDPDYPKRSDPGRAVRPIEIPKRPFSDEEREVVDSLCRVIRHDVGAAIVAAYREGRRSVRTPGQPSTWERRGQRLRELGMIVEGGVGVVEYELRLYGLQWLNSRKPLTVFNHATSTYLAGARWSLIAQGCTEPSEEEVISEAIEAAHHHGD
jgi:hypothetical protein